MWNQIGRTQHFWCRLQLVSNEWPKHLECDLLKIALALVEAFMPCCGMIKQCLYISSLVGRSQRTLRLMRPCLLLGENLLQDGLLRQCFYWCPRRMKAELNF